MKNELMIIAAMAAGMAMAEPGGRPGFLKAIFTGTSYDGTSDIRANATEYAIYPETIYATALAEHTTVGYAAYMKMTGGVTYNFKGCYDDFTTVKIGSQMVVSKGNECQERTGSFTPSSTGWYAIELRVANNGSGGGCQNSSQYGILWKKANDTDWRKFMVDADDLFYTGEISGSVAAESFTLPLIISSSVRETDPTVLDVTYKVLSDKPTVNVRALAFEDGGRSFAKIVRPETFVADMDGTPTASNVGDNIAANVEHKLAWKVSSDWKTDLAKVSFEILVSDEGQLPIDVVEISAQGGYPKVTVGTNVQTGEDVFNALLWYYANGESDLTLSGGVLSSGGKVLATNGHLGSSAISDMWDGGYGARAGGFCTDSFTRESSYCVWNDLENSTKYIYGKMGWKVLWGAAVAYANSAMRTSLSPIAHVQYPCKHDAFSLPSGLPGLLCDAFTGTSLNTASSVGSGFSHRELGPVMGLISQGDASQSYSSPLDGMTTTWQEYITFAYVGQIYLEAGKTYTFGMNIDDWEYLKIGTRVLINNTGNSFKTASFTPASTGWHDIDIRVGNSGGPGGANSGFIGIGYNTTGKTAQDNGNGWTALIDPGNGSFLRTK